MALLIVCLFQPSEASDESIKEVTDSDNRFFYQGLVGDKFHQHFNPVSTPGSY